MKLKSKIIAAGSVPGPVVKVKEIGALMTAPKTAKLLKTSDPSLQNAPDWFSVAPWLKVPLTIVMPGAQTGAPKARLPDAIASAHTARTVAFLAGKQFQLDEPCSGFPPNGHRKYIITAEPAQQPRISNAAGVESCNPAAGSLR